MHSDINMTRIELWVKRQWITKKIAYSLIQREKETDLQKVEARMKRCGECVFNLKGVCRICTCIIEVKVNSRTSLNKDLNRVEITHCPKGFWPGEEEVTDMYNIVK